MSRDFNMATSFLQNFILYGMSFESERGSEWPISLHKSDESESYQSVEISLPNYSCQCDLISVSVSILWV